MKPHALAFITLTVTGLLTACGGSEPVGPESAGGAVALPACALNAAHYNELAGDTTGKETLGAYTVPFCEEKFLSDYPDSEIPDRGTGSDGMTNPSPPAYSNLEHCKRRSEDKFYECKPAAGSIALLPDSRLIYFNALESADNAEFNFTKEFGEVSVNDQTRVLALGGNGVAAWSRPINNDGGAVNPTNNPEPGGPGDDNTGVSPNDPARNDGALFCAHLVSMHDGRVFAAGGTDYYTKGGSVELEGLKNTRIFDPGNDTWTQAGHMHWGRWYPTLASFVNGNIFVVSGVRRLINNTYPDRPADESGRNETHTEIFNLGCDGGQGRWEDNLEPGRRSLPLFARMHLLPNNQAAYLGGGQAFNPFGQSYDQALFWNTVAAYNAATNSWTEIGMPGSSMPGFRGSTSNIMLPLIPDATTGTYNKAEFLTMGGTVGLSPGNPTPITESRIDTITIAPVTGAMTLSTEEVGAIKAARWYGQGVLLPTGAVMLFSGADYDEVQSPGGGAPILDAELFDPVTKAWIVMARQGKPRTYHNAATLLPDGRVLVGGHAPIPSGYALYADQPGKSPQGRDPSFEIFNPPYVFKNRPAITSAPGTAAPGSSINVLTPNGASVASGGYAVLVRRGAITHLVDGDQRNVVLRIESSTPSSLTLRIPNNNPATNQAVVPPGHYLLFLVHQDGTDLVPSVAAPLRITGADLSPGNCTPR